MQTIDPSSTTRSDGTVPHKKFSPYEDFTSTKPDTLNGRYLRRFWHPVERADRLAPGHAKPLRVLSEDFTLYRGASGTPHVVARRCPHRGTQLSVGFVEDDCIRCLYHGWKFAEPPPFPHLPPFESDGLLENADHFFPCNFFQGYENDWDEYHTAFTHRTGGVHLAPVLADETFQETEFGVVKHARKEDGSSRVAAFIFPGTVRLTIPSPSYYRYRNLGPLNRETYLTHCPIDDENHRVFIAQSVVVPEAERAAYLEHFAYVDRVLTEQPAHLLAQEVLAGRKTLAEVRANEEYPAIVRIEDQCAQPGQGAIADRTAERLGKSDKGIITLRKIWSRELQALAETGRPKDWTVMERMPAARAASA
jgi:5,5'-dehydrodivanillate O-demethylase